MTETRAAGAEREESRRRGGGGKSATAASAVLVALGIALSVWLASGERLVRLEDWLDVAGAWGVAAYVAAVVLWTLTTVPAIPLFAVGGLLFGPGLGTLWSLAGTTLGATLTYALGRRFGRSALGRLRARHRRVERVVRLVRRHPIVAVGLVRAVPVFPLTLLNYGFGAARVPFLLYLLASVATTVPGVAFYAGLADGIRQAVREGEVATSTIVWVAALALVSVAVGLFLRRRAASGAANGGDA